ncbi:hypothetical protein QF046_000687 [Microbacterium sp. W4I4]|nr:hypothetical protein [Microbacterium sp. W4I4]
MSGLRSTARFSDPCAGGSLRQTFSTQEAAPDMSGAASDVYEESCQLVAGAASSTTSGGVTPSPQTGAGRLTV